MAVRTQSALHDRIVVGRESIPPQVRDVDVTEAALHVFNNFVDEIARVTPTTHTMMDTRQIPTQLRRSQRFMKPLQADFVGTPQAPAPNPIATPPPAAIAKATKVSSLKHELLPCMTPPRGYRVRRSTVIGSDGAVIGNGHPRRISACCSRCGRHWRRWRAADCCVRAAAVKARGEDAAGMAESIRGRR
jgi:hypothetical protein